MNKSMQHSYAQNGWIIKYPHHTSSKHPIQEIAWDFCICSAAHSGWSILAAQTLDLFTDDGPSCLFVNIWPPPTHLPPWAHAWEDTVRVQNIILLQAFLPQLGFTCWTLHFDIYKQQCVNFTRKVNKKAWSAENVKHFKEGGENCYTDLFFPMEHDKTSEA